MAGSKRKDWKGAKRGWIGVAQKEKGDIKEGAGPWPPTTDTDSRFTLDPCMGPMNQSKTKTSCLGAALVVTVIVRNDS